MGQKRLGEKLKQLRMLICIICVFYVMSKIFGFTCNIFSDFIERCVMFGTLKKLLSYCCGIIGIWEILHIVCIVIINKESYRIKVKLKSKLSAEVDKIINEQTTNNNVKTLELLILNMDIQNQQKIECLLRRLKESFESKPDGEIAYFVLSNRQNNEIMRFLRENENFKRKCEEISFAASNNKFFDDLKQDDKEKDEFFKNVSMELAHMSLAENIIDINSCVEYLKKLMCYFYTETKNSSESVSKLNALLFICSVIKIEKRLKFQNIKAGELFRAINNIKESKYVLDLVSYAGKSITKKTEHSIEHIIVCSEVLTEYWDKLSYRNKISLFMSLKKLLKEYDNKYNDYNKYYIHILAMVKPFEVKKVKENVIEDAIVSIISAIEFDKIF